MMATDTDNLRRMSEDESLPALVRMALDGCADEIERLREENAILRETPYRHKWRSNPEMFNPQRYVRVYAHTTVKR